MRFILTYFLLSLLIVNNVFGQISGGGLPYSLSHKKKVLSDILPVNIPTPDLTKVYQEDSLVNSTKKLRIGIHIPVNFSPSQSGVWTKISSEENLWRLRLKVDSASGLMVDFINFNLISGAKLFIYSSDYSQILGSFSEKNNNKSRIFSIIPIYSSDIVIEYYEPQATNHESLFTIDNITYIYKKLGITGFGSAESCMLNVNCSEGSNYTNQKRSVVRLLTYDASGSYWGSGCVINNTSKDCKPYIYTAEHNILEDGIIFPDSSYFAKFKFFFNYEAPSCARISSEGSLASQSMLGCKVLTRSHDSGGETGSDYCLLLLNDSIPESYNPYFAGWYAENISSENGVCIHHAAGDIKKISTAYNIKSSSYSNLVSGTHWRVNWKQTTNGQSVTEPGSSGSPLFTTDGYVVGKLTGGLADCLAKNEYDYFGKLSFDWASNGSGTNYQLMTWLDPQNSNTKILAGIDYTTSPITPVTPVDADKRIEIWYNPADKKISISVNDSSIQTFSIKIISLTGQIIKQITENNISGYQFEESLEGLVNGVYIFSVSSTNFTKNKKIVVVR